MAATHEGVKQARKHSYRIDKKMTFQQWGDLGREVARDIYKREKAQQEFLLSWWAIGEQFLTLFKMDDADSWGGERKLQSIRGHLGTVCTELEELLGYRREDEKLQALLQDAYELLDRMQNCLDMAAERMKGKGQ